MKISAIKVFVIVGVVTFISFLLSLLIEYYDDTKIPLPLKEAIEKAKMSSRINQTIGDILSEGYSFNTYDVEGDSINYRFYLVGSKCSISIQSHQRLINSKWILYKSDTIFTKN